VATNSVTLDPVLPDLDRGGRPPGDRSGRGPGGGGGGDSGSPGNGGSESRGGSPVAVTGMWIALAPILMLFLAFVSAYIVRQGIGSDWNAVAVPTVLWLNTAILGISSLVLEMARRQARAGGAHRVWASMALLLGIAFVVGQWLAWSELRGAGISIESTPYSSFFYLLTGAHAVHVAGGILGLLAAVLWPAVGWRGSSPALVLRVTAIYWHFLGVLWLGLFFLLQFRR
jgi:cytochrome c oxidase subunit 3